MFHAFLLPDYLRKKAARDLVKQKKKRKCMENVIQISKKILVESIPRGRASTNTKSSMTSLFPERSAPVQQLTSTAKRKIDIKFTTFKPNPIPIKSKAKQPDDRTAIVQSGEQTQKGIFDSRFVVCRRKNLKKLVFNRKVKKRIFVDYRSINL